MLERLHFLPTGFPRAAPAAWLVCCCWALLWLLLWQPPAARATSSIVSLVTDQHHNNSDTDTLNHTSTSTPPDAPDGSDAILVVLESDDVQHNTTTATHSPPTTVQTDTPSSNNPTAPSQTGKEQDEYQQVIPLDVKNFQAVVKAVKTILVNFENPGESQSYRTQCHLILTPNIEHSDCISFLPVFQSVALQLGSADMRFASVNCATQVPICQFFGVKTLPTLDLFQ